MLLKRPSVILLDEPDVHLHGSLQGVLLRELRLLVEQGKQVLMGDPFPRNDHPTQPREHPRHWIAGSQRGSRWRSTHLLHLPTITRLVGGAGQQTTFDQSLLRSEFERLVDASRNSANDRMVQPSTKSVVDRGAWDAATMARMAREFLDLYWSSENSLLRTPRMWSCRA